MKKHNTNHCFSTAKRAAEWLVKSEIPSERSRALLISASNCETAARVLSGKKNLTHSERRILIEKVVQDAIWTNYVICHTPHLSIAERMRLVWKVSESATASSLALVHAKHLTQVEREPLIEAAVATDHRNRSWILTYATTLNDEEKMILQKGTR